MSHHIPGAGRTLEPQQELRASERITAVEIFNHVAQHAATPVPPLLPPPLQDLSPTPNSSLGQTDRSGCQKPGAPQALAALPATLAPRAARCSPGTPQTRNRRRYATPRFEARTGQLSGRSPRSAETEGWSPECPVLTARGARAAQPEPQQRPQRGGTQRGHLRGRRPRRSAWGAGPDQEPRSRVRYPVPAARQVPELPLRRPGTPRSQAAARSLAESFWLRGAVRWAARVSFRLGLLPPRGSAPAAAAARPGVSRRKKRRPAARGGICASSTRQSALLARPVELRAGGG